MCDFSVIAAMCNNRGIGNKNKLPWPKIKTDYMYYTKMISPKTEGKYCAIIKGRCTWDVTGGTERTNPGYLNIIISRSNRDELHSDKLVHKVVGSLDEALDYSKTLVEDGTCERVWVLGGQSMYQEAVLHPYCDRVYLTSIYLDCEADRFFPALPDNFKEIREKDINPEIQEENGIKFQFKVFSWKKMK